MEQQHFVFAVNMSKQRIRLEKQISAKTTSNSLTLLLGPVIRANCYGKMTVDFSPKALILVTIRMSFRSELSAS